MSKSTKVMGLGFLGILFLASGHPILGILSLVMCGLVWSWDETEER